MLGPMVSLGGNSYKLIATEEYTTSATSTSAISIGTITLELNYFTSDKIIYVKIRDKAGSRNGYFVGTDAYFFNTAAANSTTTNADKVIFTFRKTSGGVYGCKASIDTNGYGVYAYSLNSSGQLAIYKRYSSSYSLAVNSTYVVEVYALDYSKNGNPFNYSY